MIILCAHVKEAAHQRRRAFPGRWAAYFSRVEVLPMQPSVAGCTTHVHPGSRTLRRTVAQEKNERKIGRTI